MAHVDSCASRRVRRCPSGSAGAGKSHSGSVVQSAVRAVHEVPVPPDVPPVSVARAVSAATMKSVEGMLQGLRAHARRRAPSAVPLTVERPFARSPTLVTCMGESPGTRTGYERSPAVVTGCGSETALATALLPDPIRPLVHLAGPVRVHTSHLVSRSSIGELVIREKLEFVGFGSPRTQSTLVPLNLTAEVVGVRPVPFTTNSHTVSLGDGLIIVERVCCFKQNPRKRSDPNPRQQVQFLNFSADSKESDGTLPCTWRGFALDGLLRVSVKQEVQDGTNGSCQVQEQIELRTGPDSTEPLTIEILPERESERQTVPLALAGRSEPCRFSESVWMAPTAVRVTRTLLLDSLTRTYAHNAKFSSKEEREYDSGRSKRTPSASAANKVSPAEQWKSVNPGPGPRIVPAQRQPSAHALRTAREPRDRRRRRKAPTATEGDNHVKKLWSELLDAADKQDASPSARTAISRRDSTHSKVSSVDAIRTARSLSDAVQTISDVRAFTNPVAANSPTHSVEALCTARSPASARQTISHARSRTAPPPRTDAVGSATPTAAEWKPSFTCVPGPYGPVFFTPSNLQTHTESPLVARTPTQMSALVSVGSVSSLAGGPPPLLMPRRRLTRPPPLTPPSRTTSLESLLGDRLRPSATNSTRSLTPVGARTADLSTLAGVTPRSSGYPTAFTPTQRSSGYPTALTPTQCSSGYPTALTPTQHSSGYLTALTPTQRSSGYPTALTPTQRSSGYPTALTPTQRSSGYPTALTPTQRSSGYPTAVPVTPTRSTSLHSLPPHGYSRFQPAISPTHTLTARSISSGCFTAHPISPATASSGYSVATSDLFPACDPEALPRRNLLSALYSPTQSAPRSPYVFDRGLGPLSSASGPLNYAVPPTASHPQTRNVGEEEELAGGRITVVSCDSQSSIESEVSLDLGKTTVMRDGKPHRMRAKRIVVNGKEVWSAGRRQK